VVSGGPSAGGGAARVLGVVLAGGRSSRMGRDKALLTFRGERLVDRAARALAQAGADEVVVSRPAGAGEWPAGLCCVADEAPFAGPLAGLAAVARARPGAEFLLALAVDQPLLGPLQLGRLVAVARGTTPPMAASYAGEPLPLLVRSGPGLRAALERLLAPGSAGGGASLRALLAAVGAAQLPLPEAERGVLANVNTPQELEELAALGEGLLPVR
jgi:molybdopterin-guanine dinucleotide biosynthesis protein A